MSMEEVVFDPRNPPRASLCVKSLPRVNGGVASYKQVMAEIGATKIIGVPKQAPMPKAPVDVAAPPADATTTQSGLITKLLKKEAAMPTDRNRCCRRALHRLADRR